MRRASGVIWPAATDQREARECKEERERGRQALPLGKEECVSQQDSQCLHHATTSFCYNLLDIQGR